MSRSIFALVFVAAAAACRSASAADLTTTLSRENKTIVVLNGELVEGDANRLRDIIKASTKSARPVSAMRLNSSGGSLIEGVRLAAIIQGAKLTTVIASGATCASACFIAFAAGNQKFAGATATVGVPGAADRFGRDAAGETPSIVRVVKELGLLDAIVEKMLATREDEIFWLTQDDLRAMGAATTGRPGPIAPEQPRAVQPSPQLAPAPKAAAPEPSTFKNWNDVVNAALAISREQNGGEPYTGRQCGLKFNSCATAVFYTGKDGKQVMVRTIKDSNGKPLVHETCTFNETKDVRTCVDWDMGTTRRDARDDKGSWRRMTDQ
jgi:hypothetical protein